MRRNKKNFTKYASCTFNVWTDDL